RRVCQLPPEDIRNAGCQENEDDRSGRLHRQQVRPDSLSTRAPGTGKRTRRRTIAVISNSKRPPTSTPEKPPPPPEVVIDLLGAVTVSCTVVVWVTDPSVPVRSEVRRVATERRSLRLSDHELPAPPDVRITETRPPVG